MADEQFDSHAQNAGFQKEVKSCGKRRNGKRAQKEGKDFHQNGDEGYNRQSQMQKPFVLFCVKGNHIQINAHGYAVKQKGNIDGKPCVDHRRDCEHKNNQTGADDEQGP